MRRPPSKGRRRTKTTATDRTAADQPPRIRVAVGLGGNVGDTTSIFRSAVSSLSTFLTAIRCSPLYQTDPIGGPSQPQFLNAVVLGTTTLSARSLLERLQELELRAGRQELRIRNGPRPLDLDLLLYGKESTRSNGLIVPHPRIALRRFVLAPLADLIPLRVIPGTGASVQRLLEASPPDRVERIAGPEWSVEPASRKRTS